MDQHPIPQNVTTFQFRLIGDMTIKQFGYLAAGALLAYISYKLPLPFFFTWPLTGLFALGGIGFAFVPIEDRPMDVWVLSFFKNVYSPTQYIWQKAGDPASKGNKTEIAPPTIAPIAPQTKPATTASRPAPVPQAPAVVVQPVSRPLPTPPTAPATPTPVPPVVIPPTPQSPPTQSPPPQVVQNTKKSFMKMLAEFFADSPKPTKTHPSVLTMQSKTEPRPAAQKANPFAWITDLFAIQSPTLTPKTPPVSHTPIIMSMHRVPSEDKQPIFSQEHVRDSTKEVDLKKSQDEQKQREAHEKQDMQKSQELEKRLHSLQEELATKATTENRVLELQKELMAITEDRTRLQEELAELRKGTRQTPVSTPPVAPPRPPVAKTALPRLTTFPNVVTGIIKDSEGNLLPGVLITIQDKDGIPQRALKTNKIGQFASSVPLPNGQYIVEVQDPRQRFAFTKQPIVLTGELVPTIEMVAQSEKAIAREKLAKEIFGKTI